MKLMLLDDEGSVLDSTEDFTSDDWENLSSLGAWMLLEGLKPRPGSRR